jgi:hypothetical protein
MKLRQEIKIKTLDIDDEETQFQITLTNGTNLTTINFYGYLDEFENFANGLLTFPKTINDTVKYELGEVGNNWAYYILLRVFCYDTNGYSAIHIKVDNNKTEPETNKCEFYITTYPASLNKFGQLLKDWNPKIEKEIVWIAECIN